MRLKKKWAAGGKDAPWLPKPKLPLFRPCLLPLLRLNPTPKFPTAYSEGKTQTDHPSKPARTGSG